MSYPHARRITLRPLAHTDALPLPHAAPSAPAGVTLSGWLEHWMDTEIEPARAETTAGGYWNIIRRHITPALGAVRLTQLSPELINGYYRWLLEDRALSPNTVRKHHILLHTALESAVRQRAIPINPTLRAIPPRALPSRVLCYTPARLARLLREVEGSPLELPVKLACYLGLRRGEALGLRWQDVDLQAGLLTVRWARTAVGYHIVEKPPKTDDSCRTLSLPATDGLLPLLRRLQARRKKRGVPCGPGDYLVLNAAGRPWHPNALSAAFAAFVANRGLPPITLHGLRHTFASVANDARVPMYQISRAMGHSSPSVTQRIYTHLFDQTHGEVLAAVAEAVVKAGSTKPLR